MTTTVNCLRCGQLCRPGKPDPTKRALRRTEHGGLCPNCAVTELLLGIEPIRQTIMGSPARGGIVPALPGKGPGVLRLPHIREQIGRVLAFTQLEPTEIDWDTIIKNWDLPWAGERAQP
jgi:hypothetical protein